MYVILTGRHPIYEHGDTMITYKEKLKNPNWFFPEGFSELAKNLFLKLVKTDPSERYTAQEALKHPWITRIPNEIPLTYYENISYEQSRSKLLNVLIE